MRYLAVYCVCTILICKIPYAKLLKAATGSSLSQEQSSSSYSNNAFIVASSPHDVASYPWSTTYNAVGSLRSYPSQTNLGILSTLDCLHNFPATASTVRDGLPTSEVSPFNGWTNFEVSSLLLKYLPFWQGERLIKRYYDNMILQIAVYQLVNDLVRPYLKFFPEVEENELKDNPESKSIMVLLSASPQILRLIIEMIRKSLPKSCVQAFQKNLLTFSIAIGTPHPIKALNDSIAYGKSIPLTHLGRVFSRSDLSIVCVVLRGVIAQKFIIQDTPEWMEQFGRPKDWRGSVLHTIHEGLPYGNTGGISIDAEEICDLIFELVRHGGTYALPLKFLAERAGSKLVQKLIDCDQQTIIRLIGNGSGIRDLIEFLPAHDSIELFKGFLRKPDSASITIDRAQKKEFVIIPSVPMIGVWSAHFDGFDTLCIFSYLSGCLCIAIETKHWKLADLLLEYRTVPWACCVGGAINAGNTELVRKLLCSNPQQSKIALKTYKALPDEIITEYSSGFRYKRTRSSFLYKTPYAEAVRSMPQEVNNLFDDLKSSVFTDGANILCCLNAATQREDEFLFRNCLNHLHISRRQSTTSSKGPYSGIYITPYEIDTALSAALYHAIVRRNAKMTTELLESGAPVTTKVILSALESREGGIVRDVLEYLDIAQCRREEQFRGWSIMEAAARWDEPTALDMLFCYPYFRNYRTHALKETIKTGNKRMMDAVLGYGVTICELEESGFLEEIIATGDTERLREWLDRGVDPCGPNMLATAIRTRNHESSQMLLFAITKRYPQGNGNYGNKELELAIELKDVTSFKMILTHLSTTSKKWLESAVVLKKAIQANGQESLLMMRTLLKYGADPDAICGEPWTLSSSMTPLLHAIMRRSVEKISLLLEKADINRPARMGIKRTPLQLATELGDRTVVEFLLNRGADPNMNAARFNGATALQLAIELGDKTIVELLLNRGADLNMNATKFNGATALQLASIKGFVGIVEMLLGRNANLFAPAAIDGGRKPFEGAAEHGRLDMMTFLVGKGVLDVEDGERQVQRAMDLAEKNGKAEAKSHAEALWKMRQQYLQTQRYEDGQVNNVLTHDQMWNL